MARAKEKTRPWKETIALILAIGAAVVSHNAVSIFADVGQHSFSQLPTVLSYLFAVVFLVLGVIAVLGIAGKTRNFLRPRLGSSHADIIRYAIDLVGIVIVVVVTLDLCRVPVAQLLVGGALTSVLLAVYEVAGLAGALSAWRRRIAAPFALA